MVFSFLLCRLKWIENLQCFSPDCGPIAMKSNTDGVYGNGWSRSGIEMWYYSTESIQIVFSCAQTDHWLHRCHLPERMTNREKPKFLLSWSIAFSPEGIAVPTIYPHFSLECSSLPVVILSKVDEEMKEECDELHNEMITSFTSLLEVRGVESAISFLMNCIL